MRTGRQTTLRDSVALSGIGVHSGLPVTLTLNPADAGTGIRFLRTGLENGAECEVAVNVHSVTATELATVLGTKAGPLVATAEHVLAALRGLAVDNVLIEIDGPEAPILDGSAADFVTAIDQVGIEVLPVARRMIKVLKPVRVAKDGAFGELAPNARGLRVEATIAFDHPMIGEQSFALDVEADTFRSEIARARTFGFMRDVAKLWSAGYALGATLENTVVVAESRVLNPEGLRYPDEFVRHKVLDAIGDLALAGLPLLAVYRTVRGGHRLNHAVVSALMADPTAWTIVEAEPARRSRGHADVATGLVAPAYAPDVS